MYSSSVPRSSIYKSNIMDENTAKHRERDTGNAGRCSKSRSKKNYSKKRKYHGKKSQPVPDKETVVADRETIVTEQADVTTLSTNTASSSKIIDIDVATDAPSSSTTTSTTLISGYRIVDVSILANVFLSLGCPGCKGNTIPRTF